MSEQTPTEPQSLPEPPRDGGPSAPKRLFRSRRDRVWAGVAGGLGEYFSVDPVIIRIAFAFSVFIGGLGAFAYVAMALFVPAAELAPGETPPPRGDRPPWIAWVVGGVAIVIALSWGVFDHGPFHGNLDGPFWIGPPLLLLALVAGAIYIVRGAGPRAPRGPGGVLLRILIAAVAFGALIVAAVFSAWAGATGHGVAVAIVVVLIGVALIATAAKGGARWLVVPAIALAAPLGIVAAADISFADSVGEREYTPTTLADVPHNGYELGMGRLVIDLRDAKWGRNEVLPLHADLGVGELVVAVPHDVCVSSDLDVNAGRVAIPGAESDGVDADEKANGSSTATPRLVLRGHVDLGQIRLVHDDDQSLSAQRRDPGQGSASAMRAACTDDAPKAPNSPESN
ncbi:hypothetical protein BH10ACT11_BH10ACT11_12670 [soil metagenome]